MTTESHTPPYLYFTHGPATKNTDNLTSRIYAIPANSTDIRLRFWHRYHTETRDGCVLEILPADEVNGLEIDVVGSGASFVKGGCTTTITQYIGLPLNKAELVGRPAWTGNRGTNFSEVVVALDPDEYAGLTLQVRWRLSTNADTASVGWWVDTFGVYAFFPSTRTLFILK